MFWNSQEASFIFEGISAAIRTPSSSEDEAEGVGERI